MTKQTEALKLALEALESIDVEYRSPSGWAVEVSFDEPKCNSAITAIKEALAEESSGTEQREHLPTRRAVERELERLANHTGMHLNDGKERVTLPGGTLRRMLNLIDRASPPAQRKPKTEEFIKHAWANSAPNIGFGDFLVLFRAIEAAHGIKENV